MPQAFVEGISTINSKPLDCSLPKKFLLVESLPSFFADRTSLHLLARHFCLLHVACAWSSSNHTNQVKKYRIINTLTPKSCDAACSNVTT